MSGGSASGLLLLLLGVLGLSLFVNGSLDQAVQRLFSPVPLTDPSPATATTALPPAGDRRIVSLA